MHKMVIGVGGSSGAIYTKVLFDRLSGLRDQVSEVGVVMSKNARYNWQQEVKNAQPEDYDFDFYDSLDFQAPFASGSAKFGTMIVCPSSMGLMARMASGLSNDLVTRAADVILKERRRLIVVPRDTPYSLIHLNNMTTLTEAGAIICPACPSFYSDPKNFEELVATVVDRVLDLAGLEIDTYRWAENS